MPVHEFRSKEYDETTWDRIWTHIKDDLKQEELMAFAPEARVAQAETRSPPVVPFPFMKLPLELRVLVYKMHFSQPAEPHHPVDNQQSLPSLKDDLERVPGDVFTHASIPLRTSCL